MLFAIAYSKDLVKEDLRQFFNDLELEYETAASERFEKVDVEVEEEEEEEEKPVKPTKPVKQTKKSKKTTKKVEKKETEEKKKL